VHRGVRDRVVLSQARAPADAVPTRMCVFTAVATIRYETNHVHDLPQLHAYLHHRRVHRAVRGEDLGAEERTNLHCDVFKLYFV